MNTNELDHLSLVDFIVAVQQRRGIGSGNVHLECIFCGEQCEKVQTVLGYKLVRMQVDLIQQLTKLVLLGGCEFVQDISITGVSVD